MVRRVGQLTDFYKSEIKPLVLFIDHVCLCFCSTKGSQVGVGDGVRGSTINHFG